MVEELPPGDGEAHPARQPCQELRAQLVFDTPNLARHRRLRDAEMTRRARNAAQLGDLHEIAEAAEIHSETAAIAAWDTKLA